MKKILFALTFTCLLLSCTNYKTQIIYSIEECKNFKKGDTIYTRENYSIIKCVVIKNIPDKELIELYEVDSKWNKNILKYDDFRFK